MKGVNLEEIRNAIRNVADFPEPGILFRDITPILSDPRLFRQIIDALSEEANQFKPDKIVGIDARGFLFGAAVAYKLGVGLVPVRKRGKLPYKKIHCSYVLEYGKADVEMHLDAVQEGERVVLVDDLLATGGTAAAAAHLVRQLNGKIEAALFFIELVELGGRQHLVDVPVRTLIQF
jgi:adenine phosphoribosyltransferase